VVDILIRITGMTTPSTSTSSSRRSGRSESARAGFRVPACPTCGSKKIRAVVRDWKGISNGKPYTVQAVEIFECPACGERVFTPDAVRQIQAASPARRHRRLARSA